MHILVCMYYQYTTMCERDKCVTCVITSVSVLVIQIFPGSSLCHNQASSVCLGSVAVLAVCVCERAGWVHWSSPGTGFPCQLTQLGQHR